jgi:demethylmenaquinone methyltransferase / 2-methoxy-6-polyprenyl-1,4-benzoquinol methylase
MALSLPEPERKAAAVRDMFDRIAKHYDRMNRLLTASLDRGWRRAAIEAARLGPGALALDVACGTGDLAALARATGARVLGVDFAPQMLRLARARRAASYLARADAAALPLAGGTVDAVTCGFALRNFVAIPPFLAEAARVLRPGGRLVLLEVATPSGAVRRALHHLYFARVVPVVGALLADRAAYAYLPRSVVYLPPGHELEAMIARAGFDEVGTRPLGAGAVQLVRATRRAER